MGRSAGQNVVLPGRTAFCQAERIVISVYLSPIYIIWHLRVAKIVLPGKTNGNIRIYISPIYIIWHLLVAKIVLPGRTAFCRAERMVISVYISPIYIIWHLRVAKIVLPCRTAFCRAEWRSAGQNGVVPGRTNGNIRIYISYIYNLTPPCRENRSAGQNGVLPGRMA